MPIRLIPVIMSLTSRLSEMLDADSEGRMSCEDKSLHENYQLGVVNIF